MSLFHSLTPLALGLAGAVQRVVPWRLFRWRKRLSSARQEALGVETRTCGEALLQFGRSSDQEFTALAQGLAKLIQSLGRLRERHAEFQLVVEDRDAEHPIASAHEVYKRSVDLVHSSIGIASSEQAQMRDIEQVLLAACGASAEFKRNQLLLNIITMSVRMEASRMDPEHQVTFLNVSDAIADISAKISASTEAAFQRIETVITETSTERSLLNGIERDLHGRAQSSIRTIQEELNALQTALAPCAEEGRAIADLFTQTEPLTMRTLSSLQHQDIVRQQLEHVAAGFNDLHQHLKEASGSNARLELGYIHHAAGVQEAHIHSARREIEQATHEVVTGLQAILETSASLVNHFGAMEAAGAAAFADFRIVVMFREEIGQLSLVADKSKEANSKISRLVNRIEEVVRVFAEEVTHHELDVKIVALNAQIAAARVPAADALDRLAEETSSVSNQNTAVTRQLLANLQDSLTQLRAIKASADEFLKIVTEERKELEAGVESVTKKLTHLSARVRADVMSVRQDFQGVHGETQNLLQRLNLAALIQQSFPPAERLCTELLAVSSAYADGRELSTQEATRLEAHRERYTMQKENVTHATALKAKAASGPAEAPVRAVVGEAPTTVASTAENLGDGIELF